MPLQSEEAMMPATAPRTGRIGPITTTQRSFLDQVWARLTVSALFAVLIFFIHILIIGYSDEAPVL